MANVVWSNPVVYVNGVDLSAQLTAFKITQKFDDLDATAINDAGKRHAAGLQDNTAEGTFKQSWASSNVDLTIQALVGSTVAIMAWPNGSTTGTTNPKYSGNFFIPEWTPMTVAPGQLATVDFNWMSDGTVARAIT